MTGTHEARVEVRDNVAILTLDAPERYNALTPEMGEHIAALLDEVDQNQQIGALVVTGAGKGFCAGANLSTLATAGADPLSQEHLNALDRLYGTFTRLGQTKVPTIAAVNGAAVGAGLNLMLAADLRLVVPHARIMGGFRRRKLHPGGGHFLLTDRLAGRETSAAVGLFDAELDGTRAVETGLAWEVVEPEHLLERALELASRPAEDPLLARAMVASFRAETGASPMSWDAAVQFERAPQFWSMRRQNS